MTLAGDRLWVITLVVVCLSCVGVAQVISEKATLITDKRTEYVQWQAGSVNCVSRNTSSDSMYLVPYYENISLEGIYYASYQAETVSEAVWGLCDGTRAVLSKDELDEAKCTEQKCAYDSKNSSCVCDEAYQYPCITSYAPKQVSRRVLIPATQSKNLDEKSMGTETKTVLSSLAVDADIKALDERALSTMVSGGKEMVFCFRAPVNAPAGTQGRISYVAYSTSSGTWDVCKSTWFNITSYPYANQVFNITAERVYLLNGSWAVDGDFIWYKATGDDYYAKTATGFSGSYEMQNATAVLPYETELTGSNASACSAFSDFQRYYHLGSGFDSSCHSNITFTGTTHIRSNLTNNASYWDGNDYSSILDWYPNNQPFSISLWFRANVSQSSAEGHMASTFNGGSNGLYIAILDGAETLYVAMTDSASTSCLYNTDVIVGSVADAKWHNLVVQSNISAGHQIWYDGRLRYQSNTSCSGFNWSVGNGLMLGAKNTAGSPTANRYYLGELDEVSIMNRSRTADEIQDAVRNIQNRTSGLLNTTEITPVSNLGILSIAGAGNNSVINDPTPTVSFNFSASSNASCELKVNGSLGFGLNASALPNVANNITVNQTLGSNKTYNISVFCDGLESGRWNITIKNNVSILSIAGVQNNSWASDLTPEVSFNFSSSENLSCELKVNGSLGFGLNASSSPTVLTNITVNQTLIDNKSINFSVVCNGEESKSWNISIDVSAPSTNATAVNSSNGSYIFGQWTTSSYVNITLTCNDSSGVGCNKTIYCLDKANSCSPNTTYSVPVQVSTVGESYIRYFSNDSLGWNESAQSQTIRINDTTAPVLTISSPSSTTYLTNLILVSFNATDNVNVSTLWYYNGTGNTTYTTAHTLTLGVGAYTFRFYANDTSGNIANQNVSFVVSSTSPASTSCLTNYSLVATLSIPSGKNWTLVNMSAMSEYVSVNMSNVYADVDGFFNNSLPYCYLINTTGETSVSIYLATTGTQSHTVLGASMDYEVNISSSNFTQTYPFYVLNVQEMRTGTAWDYSFSNSTLLRIICDDEGYNEIDLDLLNQTTIQVATAQIPYRFLITYLTSGWSLFSTQAPDTNFSDNMGLFLIDARPAQNTTPVLMNFELMDLSMLFYGARMELTTYVNGNLTVIGSDYFEADNKAHFYLIDKDRYILTVEKGTESRQIGWLTVLGVVDTDITLTLTGISGINDMTRDRYFSYSMSADFNSSTVSLVYQDTANQTVDVGFYVYNATSKALLYEGHSSSPNATMNYIVPVRNTTYILEMSVNHTLIGYERIRRALGLYNESARYMDWGTIGGSPLGLSDSGWYKIVAVGLMLMTASVFGAITAGAGAIILGFEGLMFNYFGWFSTGALQIALYPIFSVFIFIALLSKLTEKRRAI